MTLPPNVKDLLLAPRLDPRQAAALLEPYGLKDPVKGDANLQAMAEDPSERELLAEILYDLLLCVSQSADPDQALNYFERFARAAIHRTRLYSYLKDSPETLDILAKTLGGSPYMAEILIRDPHHFYWLTDSEIINSIRRKRSIERELLQTLKVLEEEKAQLDYIRFFKRREMLHIGVRDLLRISTVEETLTALSVLAEALISAACWISASALKRQSEISTKVFTGFTVLGMGKLGGGELNFSSDVDLIYLYASDAENHGSLSAAEYFRRLCRKITAALHDFTPEGYVYRVDLRLRPEGKSGYIAYPLDGFKRYYQTRVGTWERLALLKAWPVAGNRQLGRAFLDMARAFIYDLPFDNKSLQDMRKMKRQIDEKMSARDQRDTNVKLGTGGIREIELIAQTIQARHGGRFPSIRQRNTLKALGALFNTSLLSAEEHHTLTRAYLFLRDVENKLQMANDTQTHSLPNDAAELNTCARRLGYTGTNAISASDQFLTDYRRHTQHVNRIFDARFYQST